ncbi:MAG TPA: ClpXP protease specificity-enhancing factor [Thiobacillaceae bacterium]|nr:ClpXP protease specificity-enhancing factor [Thiobacillaceae bacterium]HNU65469.1 ClpXP protease specificity-enhancing factor [Thiobacillaceae bacterium]
MSALPQQPYFLRALYEWCVDSGYTPYLAVRVDDHCRVPAGFVKDGQIVLNVGPSAVRNLRMDNERVSFSARFGGVAHSIDVPIGNVLSIYARETGQGMGFADLDTGSWPDERGVADPDGASQERPGPGEDEPPMPPRGRPSLRIVK